MPVPDRLSSTGGRASTASGRRHLAVGALVVALLVGAYVLLGAPGLHTQVANAPGVPATEVATQQASTPADGPAPSTPAR